MDDRLQAYFKEYEMLTAENRLWLAASDPKLTVAFTACIGLAGAGVWKGVYAMFLGIPFVIVFLGFILLFQLSNIVHIAAQLAVLEEKINAHIGSEAAFTYFSRTIIRITDHRSCRDPQTGRNKVSMNSTYGCLLVGALILGLGLALWYALPALFSQSPFLAVVYGTTLELSVITLYLLFIKISRSKQFYINVIRGNFDTDTNKDKETSNQTPEETARTLADPQGDGVAGGGGEGQT